MIITRRYELDAGHRVPYHGGKCANLHGHRYVVEASIEGVVHPDGPSEDAGMVLDFGALKAAMAFVLLPLDHKLLLWEEDPWASALVHVDRNVVLLPFTPTAERLAECWANEIATAAEVPLCRLVVWETPNCSAVWTP